MRDRTSISSSPFPDFQGRRWVRVTWLVEHYGLSASFWAKLREDGGGPAYQWLGHRTLLYDLDSVEAWILGRTVQDTSDPLYRRLSPRFRAGKKPRKPEGKTAKRTKPSLGTVGEDPPSEESEPFGLP